MRRIQHGFVGLIVLLLIGAVTAAYYLKDENGVSYFSRMTHKKEEVMKEVDRYKGLMEKHDAELEKNMK